MLSKAMRIGDRRRMIVVPMLLLFAGCAGSSCEEWGTREVVNYNFCNSNPASSSAGMVQSGQAGECVAPGVSSVPYCVKRPEVSGEPVNR